MKKCIFLLGLILSIQAYSMEYDPNDVKINLDSSVSVVNSSCNLQHKLSNIRIETTNLIIKPINHNNDLDFCCEMFGDKNLMSLYSTGETRGMQRVSNWLQTLENRWLKGDPFSAFIIQLKPHIKIKNQLKASKVGFYNMGHGRGKGVAELGVISSPLCQKLDLSDEISNSLLNTWPKVLVKFSQECGPKGNKGLFHTIASTALAKNKASIYNLKRNGFEQDSNWQKSRLMKGGTFKNKQLQENYYTRSALFNSNDNSNDESKDDT